MKLAEDLLQVEYKNKLILDLGWYPEFDYKGHFILKVVKNYNWDEPIINKKITTLDDLYIEILKSIHLIESMEK